MCTLLTRFRDLVFRNPISNAAGVMGCYTEELDQMFRSHSGTMITKSATLCPRKGNDWPAYWENSQISVNSMGLPNNGIEYYIDYIRNLPKDKHCFLSIANIDNDDTAAIMQYVNELDYIKYPEINVSCPNIIGKEQLAYNYEALDDFLTNIMDKNYTKPYGLKLPPYFDPIHINLVGDIVDSHPNIVFLSCVNSVGNVLHIDMDTEKSVIVPKSGLGGLGGDYILPVALSNVYQFKKRLPYIDIIGCGGIRSGEDVFKHILVGATFVQIGTHLNRKGIGCIERIEEELRHIMVNKGYQNLDEFRGHYK